MKYSDEGVEMSNWNTKTLGELTSYIAKGIPPVYVEEKTNDTVFVLNQKCNRNYRISYDDSRLHNNAIKKVPDVKMLKPGDVLINSTGTGTAGRVAQIWDIKAPTTFDGHMILMRPTDEIEPLYYGYAIKAYQSTIESFAEGSTGQTEINKSRLQNELLISYPVDKNKQVAISRILAAIDEKTLLNEKINENLQEQARSIFQSWFIDFEPFGGAAPSDWHSSTLGQVAIMKTDSWSPAKNPDVVVEHYSIPAFDEQHYPVFEIASGIKSNKYILTPDSVMISKLNPDTKRIWRPVCLSEHPVCSTEFIVYEAKKNEQRDYIYSLIDSIPFFNHLCSHTTGSTNSRQRATPKTTLEFSFLLPPDSVIEEFCNIVTPMYDLIASNLVENQTLTKTRDSLLPRLMSGELDVSDLVL